MLLFFIGFPLDGRHVPYPSDDSSLSPFFPRCRVIPPQCKWETQLASTLMPSTGKTWIGGWSRWTNRKNSRPPLYLKLLIKY